MALSDVMLGLQTWTDYVSTGDQTKALRTALVDQRGVLVSSQRDTQLAIEATSRKLGHSLDEGLAWVAGGIATFNADFNLLMGETIWLLQLQETHLRSILETLQAPLDTAAKELRRRAERAYENGWYDEALADFVESAARNYQDFAVHRSIGNIYLFHRGEPDKAVDCFTKAAKYARAVDTIQAAEAHYYAAVSSAVLTRWLDAHQQISEAAALSPSFGEAHYLAALICSIQTDGTRATSALRTAVSCDARYFERAEQEPVFNGIRGAIEEALSGLVTNEETRVRIVFEILDEVLTLARDVGLTSDVSPYRDRINTLRQTLEPRTYITLRRCRETAASLFSGLARALEARQSARIEDAKREVTMMTNSESRIHRHGSAAEQLKTQLRDSAMSADNARTANVKRTLWIGLGLAALALIAGGGLAMAVVIIATFGAVGLQYAVSSFDLRRVMRVQGAGLMEVMTSADLAVEALAMSASRIRAKEHEVHRLTNDLARLRAWFESTQAHLAG